MPEGAYCDVCANFWEMIVPGLFFSKCIFSRMAISSLVFSLAACGNSGGSGSAGAASAKATGDASGQSIAMAASEQVSLEVPSSLNAEPFNTERKLTVPPGFGIRLWARVTGARFMELAPNGDVLVSHPGSGKIFLLRDQGSEVPQTVEFATGMQKPHDMVFHTIGSTTYLYIAESNRVSRAVYRNGDTRLGSRQVVVDNLPDASNTELRGSYFHELKNIAISPDNKLYVSIASSCNSCLEDVESDPQRGAIYEYNADGSGRRLYARGLRNAEGLDFIPGTKVLWVAVNNRDQIRYPLNKDFDGNGTNDYGKILPKYVDENPPEPFTRVRDGGHYGWPFCNSLPNASMSNLELMRDVDLNPSLTQLDCAKADRSSKGIRAHSAPLGLSFLHNSAVPQEYRRGAAIALHGCWNCTSLRAGYKVVYFPFDEAGNAGNEMDLVTGFVTDPDKRIRWGRPVDVIADAKGNLLISDDYAGAIYQLYPKNR
jgi:glucose/arabinose dehydrogenase